MTKYYILLFFFFTLRLNAFPLFDTTAARSSDSLHVSRNTSMHAAPGLSDSVKKYMPDTTVKKKKIEPLNYVFTRPINSNSKFVSDSTFLWNDYRYAADLMNSLPGFFVQGLGTLGQPEEVMLYGQGLQNIGYSQDGVPLNYYAQNYFNLNQLQTESIDSIELVPLSRSFLYGSENNAVAVNTLSSFRISRVPYTRIKFYQAADQEAMLDLQLHEQIYKKVNLFFELTNRKKDLPYLNTGYSNWAGRLGLTYPLIDSALSVGLEYSYHRTITGLWGGVNYDSLVSLYGGQAKQYLYNYSYQIPFQPYNEEKEQTNYFIFKLNSNVIEKQPGSLRLYYRDDRNDFSLHHDLPLTNIRRNDFHLIEHLLGAGIAQRIQLPLLHIDASAGIERWMTNLTVLSDGSRQTRSYASGVATFDLPDSIIVPSAFIKYLNKGGSLYPGIGADITIKLPGDFRLYGGLSRYSQSFLPDNNTITNLEIRLDGKLPHGYFSLTGYRTKPGENYQRQALVWKDSSLVSTSVPSFIANVTGVQLSLKQAFHPFSLEASVNYVHETEQSDKPQTVPAWSGTAGFYYEGIHFSSSLHIKTGLVATFSTAFHPRSYDYFSMQSFPSASVTETPVPFNLNFTAAGEIKKLAIVYFTWENLFDYGYYYVPYYPMPRRSLRFGIAWDLFN
jgi:hypothetical protein